MFYSPLRYPGGKSKLTSYVLETIKLNNLEGGIYVEPFAGGCAIAWSLLLDGHVSKVYINDLDPSLYSFWFSVLNHTDELCKKIEQTQITMDEWYAQKAIQQNKDNIDLDIGDNRFLLGFSTFFLNRTNHSGVIKGGVIGGMHQIGDYKLDCRFTKEELIKKIRAIAKFKQAIVLTNLDAVDFLKRNVSRIKNKKCLVNLDPPYYVKGKGLYQNFFEHDDHYRVFQAVKNIKHPWIVTYDAVPQITDIYSEFVIEEFNLTYTVTKKYKGKEVLIRRPELVTPSFPPGLSKKQHKHFLLENNIVA